MISGVISRAPLVFFIGIFLIRRVEFNIESGDISVFQGLLAYGFKLKVNIGGSLYDLLCRQIGDSV